MQVLPGAMTPWDQAIQIDITHPVRMPGRSVLLMRLQSSNVCYINHSEIKVYIAYGVDNLHTVF